MCDSCGCSEASEQKMEAKVETKKKERPKAPN